MTNEPDLEPDERPLSLPMEFWLFICENKAWWMAPILISLGLIFALAAFAEWSGLPWLYTFF